jgi:hypothetical protein
VGSPGTPPTLIIIPKMINPIHVMILIMARTNSTAVSILSADKRQTNRVKGNIYPLRILALQILE